MIIKNKNQRLLKCVEIPENFTSLLLSLSAEAFLNLQPLQNKW